MRTLSYLVNVLVLAATSWGAVSVTPQEQARKDDWVLQNLLTAGNTPPFSFVHGGQPSSGLLPSWTRVATDTSLDVYRTQHVLTWTNASGLEVKCVAVEYNDYPVVEWTVYLKNNGGADTPIISSIQGLDAAFLRDAAGEFVLNGIKGDWCTEDSYQPYQTTLGPNASRTFAPQITSGKSSDGPDGWPYFNLQMPGGGLIMAVGWPGQWQTSFVRDASTGITVRAGQQLTSLLLHPGETVRTPLIAILFWNGTDIVRAQNIWRRWYMAHTIPRVGGQRPTPLAQIQVGGNDTNYVDSFLQAGIAVDICWRDAGGGNTWYKNSGSPYGGGNDWLNTGTWEVDPAKYPDGFKPFSDWIRARGMKFVLWFEPERVGDPNSWLGLNHPEWLLSPGSVGLIFNEGNPAAFNWLTNRFDSLIKSNGVDWYREDMNGNGPGPTWRANDAGNRQGITENFYVQGHLALWDGLVSMNPGLRIDSCASGGRRNDLETMRRAVPLLRSDYQWDSLPGNIYDGNQCHTHGLSSWLPFQGQGVYAYDAYSFRSFYMSSFGMGTLTSGNTAAQKQAYSECRRIAPCMLYGDYYPLTPYSLANNVWIAWQFDWPEQTNGVVQVFRRANSPDASLVVTFQGLETNRMYAVEDFDKGALGVYAGSNLMTAGLTVQLDPRQSAILFYSQATGVYVTAAASTNEGLSPLPVQFSASGVSAEGFSLTYAWTFGDGGTAATANPSHTYTNAGRYVAEVTADDDHGNTGKVQIPVTALGGSNRVFISFDGYNKSETLTNFPVLVTLGTHLTANGFAYDQVASSNGWDLMFMDSGMTRSLNHEIERWDTNGLSYVWVQVPLLVQGGGIWAYWGSTNMATAPASCMTNGSVWTEGFAGVWHMTNGVTLSGVDSTANRNNGTVGSGATATSGLIDGGGQFDASINACVNMGTLNPLPAGTGTASIWVNWNVTSGNGWAMAKGADFSSGNSWGIAVLPQSASQCNVLLYYDVSGAAYPAAATIASGTGVWHHVTAVMGPNAQYLYVDGALGATRNRATLAPNAGNGFNIGKTDRASPYHYAFFGALDEARVATAQRSADWVWAEYQTMASNMTFATYGTVSLVGDSNLAPTVATPAQANPSPVTGTTAELTALGADDIGESVLKYTWSATGTPPASVSFVPNGNNAAKNATATFGKAGSYSLQVVIRDPYGATTTSSVAVVVNQTLTSIAVVPVSALVQTNLTRQFATTGFDQFGRTMDAQPGFAWGVSGGGTISAGGLFKAGALAGGPYTVTASAGGKTGEATVVVSDLPSVVPTKMLVRFAGYTNRTEVLTNFPVLVVFSNNVGGSGFNYGNFLSPGGYDLRFVTNLADTTSLNYEIESWNTNAGQASHVWVQVPTIPSDGSGYIWAKWGDPAHSNQLPYTTNGAVWANGYVGVWHLTNGLNLSGADSTANRNNGVVGSGAVATGGLIDGGGEFHGTFNDYVGLGTLNPLPNGTGTASVWAKWTADALAKNNYVLAKGNDNGPVSWGFDLIPSDTSCSLYLLYGSGQWVGPAAIQSVPGIWHLVTAVMRPGAQELYVDGVLALTGAKATITPAAGEGFFIGKTSRATPYAYPANGTLDEVRVATAQRSADWIWAEWMSVASNAVFAQCGKVRESGTDYEQWQTQYFTESELTDENVSGDTADPDDDKMSNLQEFYARTGPRDQSSFLKIDSAQTVTEGSGGFVVRWSSAAGVFYRLTRATNLADWVPDWVVENIESTPTENVYTDAVPPNPSAFYRIEVQKAQ